MKPPIICDCTSTSTPPPPLPLPPGFRIAPMLIGRLPLRSQTACSRILTHSSGTKSCLGDRVGGNQLLLSSTSHNINPASGKNWRNNLNLKPHLDFVITLYGSVIVVEIMEFCGLHKIAFLCGSMAPTLWSERHPHKLYETPSWRHIDQGSNHCAPHTRLGFFLYWQ